MLVMVIGAGPAGLRAASALQRLDIPVVLVDPSPVGGALNQGYDYENSRTHERESSLALKGRLLAFWGDAGPPLLVDRVLSATWRPRERTWDVKLARGERTVSWILAATGVPAGPGGSVEGLASHPVPLIVDGKNLSLSADGRYPDVEGRALPWQAIGDARTGAPWTIDEAIFSANAAVARVANALRPHTKHHLPGFA